MDPLHELQPFAERKKYSQVADQSSSSVKVNINLTRLKSESETATHEEEAAGLVTKTPHANKSMNS